MWQEVARGKLMFFRKLKNQINDLDKTAELEKQLEEL